MEQQRMLAEQLPLTRGGSRGEYPQPLTKLKPVSSSSSIAATLSTYDAHLSASAYSPHTIKAYLQDIKLLAKFLGPNANLRQIGTSHLNQFLSFLRTVRKVPCSLKLLSRRINALKNFFC